MCGIAGSTRGERETLAAMGARLAHRGPDDHGVWQAAEGGMGLVHARLAVIDLTPGGHQPMVSDCGRHVLVFNGEIYNYRELRGQLEKQGEHFHSSSDTEVLLALLRRYGVQAVHRLAGMFAFAWWDQAERSLTLVRDRLGAKPLLYAPLADGGLAFASEIHALRAHSGIDLALDREALSQYLACLYVPAPLTIHAGIRKLPPGHWLRWQPERGLETECYWQPRVSGQNAMTVDEAVESVLPLLRRAVTERMVADVPVGCFLSGGIDSGVIAALMAEESRRQGGPAIRTFTMGFDESAYDESVPARAIAAHVGSIHTELPASPSVVGNLERMVQAFGEPFGNPTALLIDDLSRQTRQHVTVALAGDAGDEVFAGYPRYAGGLLAGRYRKAVPAWLRRGIVAPLARFIPESSAGRHAWRRAREFLTSASLSDDRMYAAWVEYFTPAERAAFLRSAAIPESPVAALYRQAQSRHPLDAMQHTDLVSFLPGNLLSYGDAMSMVHALEVRLPMLDHRLIEQIQAISPAMRFAEGKKTILRRIARRLLPSDIVDRPKLGFNPPMGLWLKQELAPMVAERLTPARMEACGLDWRPVAALLDDHRRGGRDVALKLWSLLVLDAWRQSL